MRVMDKPANTDGAPSGGVRRAALFALLLIAFGLRLSDMVIVGNTHHPDEIFQTLEPGHRLWTGMGVVTWEWREGIRSWALPAVIAIIMRLSALVSETPLVYLGGVHAVLALSSLLIVYVAFRMGERVAGFTGAMIAGLLCALWPDLVYYGARSSSEAVATPLLVLVVYLASIHDGSREDGKRRLLWIGVLLGVVFILRFHLALALFVIAAWTCRTDIRGRWLPLIAAAALPVVASGLFDWATLGTPFQSIWKNFWINIIDSRSTSYGTHGRLFFLRGVVSELGLAIIPVVVGLLAGARRAPLFVLSAAAVYLTFSAIAHKEMRFVYPATPLLVIAVSVGLAALVAWLAQQFSFSRRLRQVTGVGLAAIVVLLAAIAPASRLRSEIRTLTADASTDPGPPNSRQVKRAEAFVAARPDLCGLAMVEVNWHLSGGYSHLHRSAPIYLYRQVSPETPKNEPDLAGWRAFNYAIVKRGAVIAPGFDQLRCWGSVCVFRREGACTPQQAAEFSRVLESYGH